MTRIRAAFIALIIASVALAAYGDRAGGSPEFMPRDPGAARKNLSNVDAATGRSALGLGTMATEAKTDYVATDTFTAHVADNSDIHGCTAIASASAVADALSAANASDALNVRLNGIRPMTGSLKFSGNYGIVQSTSDGADTGHTVFGGGGGGGNDRGGVIFNYGNEHATAAGQMRYYTGNVSTGDHVFYTGNGTERFRIGYDGKAYFSSYLKLKGNYGLSQDTESGSDNRYITINGGGAEADSSRGSYITVYGNNVPTYAGQMRLNAGSVGTGHIIFTAGAAERMCLTYGGNLLIGTMTDDGTNKLQVSGSVAISSFAQLASPTAIPTAAKGRIYFNGSESKFKKCTDGSNWVDM